MAVVQMQRMNIFGLKADRKQILERVQRWGLMEVDIQLEDAQFSCSDTLAQRQQFDRQIRALQQALELLDRYAPEKKGLAGMLGGKTQITQAEYAAIVQDQAAVMRKANAMLEEEKSIAADQAAIAKLQAQQESLTPWLGLDVPMNAKGTARAALLCGTLPGQWDQQTCRQSLHPLPRRSTLTMRRSYFRTETCAISALLSCGSRRSRWSRHCGASALPGPPSAARRPRPRRGKIWRARCGS